MIIENGIDVNFKFDSNLISKYFGYVESQPNRFERKLERLRYLIDDLDSPLHLAAALDNKYLCRILLDKGADINARNREEITPIQKAINTHNFQIFQYLIIAGADCNITDIWGRTPLMNASKECDANFLKYLLKVNLDLEASCLPDGNLTAIFYSIQSRNFLNLKLLLEAGADIGKKDLSNSTLLHQACLYESREVASFLIKSGADVNEKDVWGDAPLSMTIENKSNEIAKMLIQAGASINAKNKIRETALYKASDTYKPVIIHTLLDAGANAHIGKINDFLPFDSAAFGITISREAHDIRRPTYSFPGDIQLPNNLIEWINSCKSQVAMMENHLLGKSNITLLSLLLENDQNSNLISKYFGYVESQPNRFERKLERLRYLIDDLDSPLHLAAALDNKYLCRILLDKGADINARNREEITPIQKAINTHNFQIFQYLIIAGADCNITDIGGRTPLMNASKECDANFLKYLLKVNLDLEASCLPDGNLTAIFYSIQSRNFLNFKLLLEAGADIGKKDLSNSTLLHQACLYESREVASFLIKSGADVNEKDVWGDAPLSMTIENKSNEIAKMLIQAGASINAKNKNRETALYKASDTYKPVIIHTLLDAGANANIGKINAFLPFDSAAFGITISREAHDISVYIVIKRLLRYSTHFNLTKYFRFFQIYNTSFEDIPFVKLMISYFVLGRPTYSFPGDIQLPNNLIEWMNSCKSQVAMMENHLLGKSNITLLSFLLENDQN
ncbi:hypothetical protein LAZ67_9003704, partial [Cordylochernes scorpioides]